MTPNPETSVQHRRGQRGIALVAVVWMLVLLALLAANFTRSTQTGTYLARNLVANAEAQALADAGVHRAVAGLLERAPERQLALDGTPYRFALGNGEVQISLQDETGKIDLNRTPVSMLQALFLTVGLEDAAAQALADAVADYRDRDDRRRPMGAEAAEYRAAGARHGPRNGRFAVIEELRQVLGMTDSIYRLVLPAITVHGRGRRINRETAPELVLRALLADEAATAQRARDGGARRLDAADDKEALSDDDEPNARPARPSRSRGAVTVTARGQSASGGVFVREAIVRVSGNRNRRGARPPFDILAWREGLGMPASGRISP